MRVLRSSALKITSPAFVGDDGETPEDCASTPTATVAHEDGTALAALSPASGVSDGEYTATLTATHTANLGRLTVTWTGTVDSLVQVYPQQIDVVGAHIVSLPEIRDLKGMDDITKFPIAVLRRVRDHWADRLEEVCGVSFVPRYQRDVLDGDATSRLALSKVLPSSLVSVTVDGVAQTTSEFTLDEEGAIRWSGATFPRSTTPGNVIIAYEHGYPACPEDVRHPLLEVIRADIARTRQDAPSDAISETFDGGATIRYSTPDPARGRPTGHLALDAALNAGHMYRHPAVG